jgi:type IV pilus assembly protein PilF
MFKMLKVGICFLALTNCVSSDHPATIVSNTPPDYKKAALLNVQMGETYFAKGQYMRAKTKFLHALELQPKLPEVHSALAYYYERIGEDLLAQEHHLKAIRYGDNRGMFYNNYGTFLCNKGRYGEADKAFNKVLQDTQYIQTAQVYENAGSCALKDHKVAKAQAYFVKAVNHDPGRSETLLSIADCDYKLKHYEQAKHHLDEYIQTHKHNPPSLLLSILINKQLNNQDIVASDSIKLRNLYPDSSEALEYKKMVSNANN